MKHLKILFRISIAVTLILVLIEYVFNGANIASFHWKKVLVQFSYSFLITLFNFIYFVWLEKKYDWKTESKKRYVIGVVGSTIVTLFAFLSCRIIHLVIIENSYTLNEFIENESIKNYFFPFLLSLIMSLFLHAFYFYKAMQESKVTEQKLIAGHASAKFDALKNQLDPHFLFNSLNVLTSLIEENPGQAQNFTTSLSKVYRYVLEQKNKELVTVEDELTFAKRYVGLLKMRFENSITYHFPKKISNPEAKIIPLSLQLLLENAVKHNVVSEENPLHISIFEEDGCLVVKNNLQTKNVMGESSGYGLLNIQQRYGLLTSRKVKIEKSKTTFQVKLPILTKQLSYLKQQPKMNIHMKDYEKLDRAREMVKKQKDFYSSLTSYMIVIPFLAFINWFTMGFGFPWFLFAAAGWGIGLIFQYMEAFDRNPFFSKDWEKRKIKQFMDEDKF
ncbi:2TM domain-containing protein [Mesonia sp. JHPTF-M18]|uniref:2TM domain-containing protein n=1 Tax=Mesonia aestuariivivens TaxID=2796128 RepID=A0ABS6W1M5_9FLAO|nr:2TM domain-containing protein [Mesonia aestuariivivens]